MTMFTEELAGLSGGRVLDVATEGGWFIDKLMDMFGGIDEIIGIDISDEEFEEARERHRNDPVSFIVMNGASLDFADASFNTVAMAHGMHHLDDISKVLLEMMRVLKSGGTFVLREVYRDGQNEKQMTDVFQHDWYAQIDRLLGKPHYPSLTRRRILDYAKSLALNQFETREHLCVDCPRSKGETIDKEISEMDAQLAMVRELPQYDELKAEMDAIVKRFKTVGICCQSALEIVGIK